MCALSGNMTMVHGVHQLLTHLWYVRNVLGKKCDGNFEGVSSPMRSNPFSDRSWGYCDVREEYAVTEILCDGAIVALPGLCHWNLTTMQVAKVFSLHFPDIINDILWF